MVPSMAYLRVWCKHVIAYDGIRWQGPSDVLDYGDNKTRASLAQTLAVKCEKDIEECPAFTLVVNHLKSKGSSCDSIGDPDVGDGQVSK